MILEIFKRVQLFIYGFSLSLSAIVWLGIYGGSIDKFELQQRYAEFVVGFIEKNPEEMSRGLRMLLSAAENMQARKETDQPEAAAPFPATPAKSNLEALRDRQRKSNY